MCNVNVIHDWNQIDHIGKIFEVKLVYWEFPVDESPTTVEERERERERASESEWERDTSPQHRHMEVSINGGTPKSSILVGFSIIKPSILGYPHDYGKPHIFYQHKHASTPSENQAESGTSSHVVWHHMASSKTKHTQKNNIFPF